MTPAETYKTIEVFAWRMEEEHRMRAWTVWQAARLTRVKKFPPLNELIKAPGAKVLTDEQATERRSEFEELKAKWAKKQH